MILTAANQKILTNIKENSMEEHLIQDGVMPSEQINVPRIYSKKQILSSDYISGRPFLLERNAFDFLMSQSNKPACDIRFFDLERKNQQQKYAVFEGVAIIPIYGALSKRSGLFDEFFGFTSYEVLSELLNCALNDPDVKGIVLDVDSPGGEVAGLFDFADQIYKSREIKPIWAVANEEAYSAAYAIASSTEKVFLTRTGGVGSIGVLATHIDQSGFDEKKGIKVTTVFAGDRKNDLNPHEPLGTEGSQVLQREVNRLYGMFVDLISRNRSLSHAQIESTQAGLFFGTDALNNGLADGVMTLPEAIEQLSKQFQPPKLGNITMTNKIKPTSNPEDVTPDELPVEQVKAEISTIDIDAVKKEAATQGREAYRVQVLELVKACSLANMPEKLGFFLEQGMDADSAKDELMKSLAAKTESSEVQSHVLPVSNAESKINPVVEAAKARAQQNQQSS